MNDARPFIRARRVAAGLAIAAILMGAAACGGDDDDTSSGTTGTTAAESNGGGGGGEGTLDVTEFKFDDVTAAAGSTLKVKNDSGAAHTFTADDGGGFDEALPNGETVDVKVPDQPGEYPFHCEIHPSMKATLTVN